MLGHGDLTPAFLFGRLGIYESWTPVFAGGGAGFLMELITKSFAKQAMAFPARVDQMLSEITTVEQAKGILDQASTLQAYAGKLKAGVELERPIAFGVLKCKSKVGELAPAEKGGRGKHAQRIGGFNRNTLSAYRKIFDNHERLEEYYHSIEDVPTQHEFIRYCGGKTVAASSSTGEIEWYTPPDIIELARKVLGKIDTDPASNAVANEYIKATTFYTKEDDGLAHDWHGNVWMNPPYAAGLVSKFTSHFESQWQDKNVKQAIVLLNNSTDTQWFASLVKHASACCFKTGRIAFVSQDGEQVAGAAQGQVFLYFGRRKLKFNQVFADVGWIAEISQ